MYEAIHCNLSNSLLAINNFLFSRSLQLPAISFPDQHRDKWCLYSIHKQMFADSVFLGPYAGHHGCCEFMNVMDMPSPKNSTSWPSLLCFYLLHSFLSPFWDIPWFMAESGDDISVPFKVQDVRYRGNSWFGYVLRYPSWQRVSCHLILQQQERQKRNRKGKRSNISLASTPQ